MLFPNNSAHAIHTCVTAAGLASAGVPTRYFPGVSFFSGSGCMEAFFARLGFEQLPEQLVLDTIPTRHKGLYGAWFRSRLARAVSRPGNCLCFASSVKEAVLALAAKERSENRHNIRVVFEMHHLISRLKNGAEAERLLALEKKAVTESDLTVFNSEALRQQAEGYLPPCRASVVSPIGYNERVVLPVPVEANKPTGSGIRLAYVGSLQRGKGVENLLRVLALLPERYTLRLIGGRPEAALQGLKALAEELGVGDRVEFAGQVEQREVGRHLEGTDIFMIPLETEGDFLAPIKMYEALGFALPIAATPMPSLRDRLTDGVHAVFAKGVAPEQLAAAVRTLGEDPALRDTLRRNNLELGRRYTASARAKELVNIFGELF